MKVKYYTSDRFRTYVEAADEYDIKFDDDILVTIPDEFYLKFKQIEQEYEEAQDQLDSVLKIAEEIKSTIKSM